MIDISESQFGALIDLLHGSCLGLGCALGTIGVDESTIDLGELEDLLCGAGIDRCQGCNLWCETSEIYEQVDGDFKNGFCEDCCSDNLQD